MTAIRIAFTDDMKAILDQFKADYPLLSYAEIIKMIISEHYTEQKKKAWQKKFEEWDASLPVRDATPEEEKAIEESRKSKGKIMTIDELFAEIENA